MQSGLKNVSSSCNSCYHHLVLRSVWKGSGLVTCLSWPCRAVWWEQCVSVLLLFPRPSGALLPQPEQSTACGEACGGRDTGVLFGGGLLLVVSSPWHSQRDQWGQEGQTCVWIYKQMTPPLVMKWWRWIKRLFLKVFKAAPSWESVIWPHINKQKAFLVMGEGLAHGSWNYHHLTGLGQNPAYWAGVIQIFWGVAWCSKSTNSPYPCSLHLGICLPSRGKSIMAECLLPLPLPAVKCWSSSVQGAAAACLDNLFPC